MVGHSLKLSKDLLLAIHDRLTDGYFHNGECYRE